MALIMVYIAFRFDLRFAPGAVFAMVHDVVITAGILVLLRREFTLTSVAALLTIVGYSVNDTIVVYDRVRENLGRLRGKSMIEIINVSTSQTLSRTVLTSLTTVISVLGFLVWGTPVIRDFALTMIIGIFIGTYSSIYVAAPLTEWLDRRYFQGPAEKSPGRAAAGAAARNA
jgi:preprotein translocase subunit SecF